MTSAIDRYGWDKAKQIVLDTLRDLSQKYPSTYFTTGSLKTLIETSILEGIANQDPSTILQVNDENRRVFSKPNLYRILHESLEVDSIRVFASGTIETAYRSNPLILPDLKIS